MKNKNLIKLEVAATEAKIAAIEEKFPDLKK